jgi:GntR family transcriptional regulator
MLSKIDRGSPLPLYHQIAETIRYRIATGAIQPGDQLPPLREAAALWGANLHTVRRAYAELSRQRVVTTRVPQGTVVLPPPAAARQSRTGQAAVDRFLRRVLHEAKEAHGLESEALIRLLAARHHAAAPADAPTVFVAECSATQSEDLAAQLRAHWDVSATAWPIGRAAPPAGSPIVATYFHYRDIARLWPARLADVRFLAIAPDPRLVPLLRARRPSVAGRSKLILCEREPLMLANIAADLERILPSERMQVLPRLVPHPSAWLAAHRGRQPVLFPPRIWGDLTDAARSDPRAVEVRYVFDPRDLEAIGPLMGWGRR